MKKILFILLVFSSLLLSCVRENFYATSQNYSGSIEVPLLQSAASTQFCQLDTLSNGLIVEVVDSAYILEGDILMSDLNIDAISSTSSRGAVRADQAQFYWPNGRIAYSFNSNFEKYEQYAIAAMDSIAAATGLVFYPKTANTSDYIYFYHSSSGNNSYIGMQGGRQVINIKNVTNISVIMHEILHSLGIFHEHSRTDRDDYITINFNNIKQEKQFNFAKYSESQYTGYNTGPFDFNSLMLYDGIITDPNFVINPSVYTITVKDTGRPTVSGSTLSAGDIEAIQSIYGPPYHRLETTVDRVVEDYESYYEERYQAWVYVIIRFYEDKACTIPVSIQFPRIIRLAKHWSRTNAQGSLSNDITYETVVVPEGSTSIPIDYYLMKEIYQYSNPIDIDRRDYSVVNRHVPELTQY